MNLLNGKYRFLLIVLVSIIGVQCRTKLRPRIFGGAAAQPGDFPYLASFRRSNWDGVIHQCGGAILTDKHILLAAHCYGKYNPISEYSIAVGALSRTDGETYKVKQFHAHEHYVPSAGMNDIAIVELEESIRFSDKVRPIELNADTIAGGIEGIVAGYGETNDYIKDLKSVHLTTMTEDECLARFARVSHGKRPPLHGETLCAYSGIASNALCFGDSGSPFVVDGRVIGIVSWGKSCGIGLPEAFTRVSNYIDWIQEIINSQ